jgi:sugar/nucleoside kinase (ribokinase family)
VEVELTVKSPRRLESTCRAWARHRGVAGVVYLAAPPVRRALLRAVVAAAAHGRVVVIDLDGSPPGALADPIAAAP